MFRKNPGSVAEKDANGVALLIGGDNIQIAITIKIRERNGNRGVSGRRLILGVKLAVSHPSSSKAQQYAYDIVVVVVGYDKVEDAVIVHVSDSDRGWIESRVIGKFLVTGLPG